MSTKTKKPHTGLAFVGMVAVAAALAFCAKEWLPLARTDRAVEKAESVAESVLSELPAASATEPADVAQSEITATPEPTAAAAFAGWDTASLDAFCAQQPSGFSVYAQDLETGDIYTYNAETEYYPASTLKAAYALWLCEQAEQGMLDMEGDVYNSFAFGTLEGTKLDAYDGVSMIPAWDAMYAMITVSDNNAMDMLVSTWPANQETGFCDFLA